jgi:hypothetical protein
MARAEDILLNGYEEKHVWWKLKINIGAASSQKALGGTL